MSQTYVVGCKASVCELKKSKDSVVSKLILTGIVEEEEQKEILVDILKKRGFEEVSESDGQVLTREKDGIIQVVDLTDMTVTTTVEKQEEIKREKSIQAHRTSRTGPGEGGYDKETEERENEKFRLEQQAELEKSIAITDEEREEIEAKLIKEISDKLQTTETERKEELNDIVKDVYVESLKKKAARMGQVTSVKETKNDSGDYELRIKLEM